jgi:hypothetical protein
VVGDGAEGAELPKGKLKVDVAAFDRSRELLQKFRRADDLDKKWNVVEMLGAIPPLTPLGWWFQSDRPEVRAK